MKDAQDYLSEYVSGRVRGGFNQRIQGCPMPTGHGQSDELQGWSKADDMIRNGEIYYTHTFPHNCRELSFKYGGSDVCNACGRRGLSRSWWNIKVMKDGSAWFVVGEGFLNLQESDNYAFGDTKKEALDSYYQLMNLNK
tara:strand:+ start:523 stop:939 length:417 start_codon:yes stop_codon:yes gene_type:complete